MTSLDHLWAGWRSEFITGAYGPGAKDGPAPDSCVFCRILASGVSDEDAHIIWRHPSGTAFAILNAYPYTSGHLMVMPTRHAADVEELTPAEAADVWEGVRAAVRAVKAAYRPEGLNLGANLGKAAGAGVPGHFHMHVLPRWAGDTSFMTTVADARVLPEPLSDSAAKLRAGWVAPAGPPAGPSVAASTAQK
jgi:diadenosine tetraphosphate (Ap4A) HIT family hydrolase